MRLSNLIRLNWMIFIIFIIGLSLRLLLFSQEVIFAGDTVRDLLFGYHIVEHLDFPLVGHAASGNGFYYPPYYFYLHALLYLLFKHPLIIIFLAVTWQTLSIILVYILGTELLDRKTGLIAAILISVSQYFFRQQFWLYSGPAATPLYLLAIIFFFRGLKRNNAKLLLLSVLLAIIGGTVTYSILIFVPLLTLLVTIFLYKNKKLTESFILLFFAMIILLILYSPLLIAYPNEFITAFSPYSHVNLSSSIIYNVFSITISLLESLIPTTYLHLWLGLYLLFLLKLYKSLALKRWNFAWLLCLILYPIFLAALRENGSSTYWFDNIMPLIILIISASFSYILSIYTNYYKKAVISLFLISIIFIATDKFNYTSYGDNQYKQSKAIAHSILSKALNISKTNDLPSLNFFHAYVLQPQYGDLNNPMLFYQLEYITKQKFVSIIPNTDRFTQLNSDDIVFLYCLWYENGSQDENCINDFSAFRPGYVLDHIMNVNSDNAVFVLKNKKSSLIL